jgi:hypothetical protein
MNGFSSGVNASWDKNVDILSPLCLQGPGQGSGIAGVTGGLEWGP